jgi:TonB-linked SusC/RagA family outer membrane protein
MERFYKLLITALLFCVSWSANAQTTLSGALTDDAGEPVVGAVVVVKGTSRSTISDIDGKYSLPVAPDDVVIFSMSGFRQVEEVVGSRTTINLQLASNTLLDEVVVAEFGISKAKRQLGISQQTIDGDDVAGTQRTNVIESLQGRVAGLSINTTSGSPGASSQIILRQGTSFSQDNQPLFVIDGVPVNNTTLNQNSLVSDKPNRDNDYSNRISDINPDDIESISILKGPEASALYGFYGANGAIIITTKKGKAGTNRISYSFNGGFQQTRTFPEVQRTYSRGAFAVSDLRYRAHFGPRYPDGTILYNNSEDFFQVGSNNQHNLSFDGGNDRVTYRVSGATTNNQGVTPTSSLKKYNLGTRVGIKVSEKLEITVGANYAAAVNIKPSKGTNGVYTGILTWPANDNMADYLDSLGNRRLTNPTLAAGETEVDNPYYDIDKNRSSDRSNRFFGNINLIYSPLKWLSLNSNTGYDFTSTIGNTFVHPLSQRGGSGGGVRGSIEDYNDNFGVFNTTYFARVSKDVGKLGISGRVGGALDEQRRRTLSSSGNRLQINDLNSITNVDPTTFRSANLLNLRRSASFFADVTFDYNRFLTLNASVRNDITSTLPVATRSFVYPGVNASFVFSELIKQKWLSYGKLRFAVAGSGKDIPAYQIASELRPQITTNGGYLNGFTGNAPDLKPETITAYSGGIELSMFKNRVGLDLTFYRQTTDDLLFRLFRISYGTGFILKNLNLGKLETEGVEATLTLVPVKTKKFKWTSIFNYTSSRGEFSGLPANIPEFYVSDTWLFGNARSSIFQPNILEQYGYGGQSNISTIGGYRYLRNTKGDVLVNPASGLPLIDNNFNPIGNRNPDFVLGLVNKVTYKGFDLSVTCDVRKGGDIFNGTAQYLWRLGLHPDAIEREKPVVVPGVLRDGKENSENPTKNNIEVVPLFRTDFYAANAEESFVEKDINWFRLRDVRLSYSIPATLLKKVKYLKSASVYVSGTDLYFTSNYSGADPNVNGTTAGVPGLSANGFDFGVLPTPRGFNVGLRIGL